MLPFFHPLNFLTMSHKSSFKSTLSKLSSICLLVAFVFSFSSCYSDKNEQRQNTFEAFASKALISSLPAEEQKQMWISRLEMYNEIDLTKEQKGMLNDLITDLKNLEREKFFMSDAIKQDAIALAQTMPREDFINLFTLDNPSPTLPVLLKKGDICTECIADIQTYVHVEPPSENSVSDRVELCNCRWTCDQQLDNCANGGQMQSSSNGTCSATGGCGFLGFQTCTNRVVCND